MLPLVADVVEGALLLSVFILVLVVALWLVRTG
jgi:hypothetical protein